MGSVAASVGHKRTLPHFFSKEKQGRRTVQDKGLRYTGAVLTSPGCRSCVSPLGERKGLIFNKVGALATQITQKCHQCDNNTAATSGEDETVHKTTQETDMFASCCG